MFIVDGDPNKIGNGDVCIRTQKGALVALIYAHHAHRAEEIAAFLNATEAESLRPDPLGEALNSGDGTYRP